MTITNGALNIDAFVVRWCADWNSHDVDKILSHFHDDVVFLSPLAKKMLPGTDGIIEGKENLRDYWQKGLELIPDLHFTVEHVFQGVDSLVIQYRNQKGQRVSEVLEFRGDKVAKGYGTYEAGV